VNGLSLLPGIVQYNNSSATTINFFFLLLQSTCRRLPFLHCASNDTTGTNGKMPHTHDVGSVQKKKGVACCTYQRMPSRYIIGALMRCYCFAARGIGAISDVLSWCSMMSARSRIIDDDRLGPEAMARPRSVSTLSRPF